MKCLNKVDLLMFIDNELQSDMNIEIEAHLKSCKDCEALYFQLLQDKKMIHDFINKTENQSDILVPSFRFIPENKKLVRKRLSIFIKVAASVLILAMLFNPILTNREVSDKAMESIAKATMEINRYQDPNKQWHENQIVVVITDDDGKVLHTWVSGKDN